ncbi:hypothetical protein V1478_013463 [Vespula squamosa]|uniref:Uncharacterized protein n=1 Tax=Vespula squamosa TaxID=30214 RepID=A0ABD2AAX8_VESSQ
MILCEDYDASVRDRWGRERSKNEEKRKRGKKGKRKRNETALSVVGSVERRSIADETLDRKRPTRVRIAVKIGKTQRTRRGEPPMGRLFFQHCKNVKRDIKGIASSPPYFV